MFTIQRLRLDMINNATASSTPLLVFLLLHSDNNNNKHAYAGAPDSFTYLRVLLVLTGRGFLVHSN
jgi:hypothetical protein